jgi:hypothetical protein
MLLKSHSPPEFFLALRQNRQIRTVSVTHMATKPRNINPIMPLPPYTAKTANNRLCAVLSWDAGEIDAGNAASGVVETKDKIKTT